MATPVDYFDHLYCTEDLHQFCSTVHRAEDAAVQTVKASWRPGNEFRDNQYSNCKTIKTEVCNLCLEPIPERDYSSRRRLDPHGAHRRCVDRLSMDQFRQWIEMDIIRY